MRSYFYSSFMIAITSVVITAFFVPNSALGMGNLGGWTPAAVDSDTTKVLEMATSEEGNYLKADMKKVCVQSINSVRKQVVNGINYDFDLLGCFLPSFSAECNEGSCAGKEVNLHVIVWFQPQPEKYAITSITESGPQINLSEEPSEKEMDLIRSWIRENGLNQFGDKKGTMYTGGTPLFDENTGQSISLYEYLVRTHPTKPWNQNTGSQSFFEETESEEMKETKSEDESNFVWWFMIGNIFMVSIIVIAVLVYSRRTRPSQYSRLNSRN